MASLAAKEFDKAAADIKAAASKIDKAGARRVLHPNTAARRKSKLARAYAAASRNLSRRESGRDGLDRRRRRTRRRCPVLGIAHWQDFCATRDEPPPCRPSTTPSTRFARPWSRHFGPATDEFEGLAPFEAMVAVVLDRALGGARWRAALDGLGDDDLLDPERLAEADDPGNRRRPARERGRGHGQDDRPAQASRSLGRRPRRHGRLGRRRRDTGAMPVPLAWLREELAAIKGIGPAAADAIVLFALKRPSYPVDRATLPGARPSWLARSDGNLRRGPRPRGRAGRSSDDRRAEEQRGGALWRDLSHGMERLGRQFCRAAAPHCGGCPLEHLLPEGGPREVDA